MDAIKRATVGAVTKQDADEDVFAAAFDRFWSSREGAAGKWMVRVMLAGLFGAVLLFVLAHAHKVTAAAAGASGMAGGGV